MIIGVGYFFTKGCTLVTFVNSLIDPIVQKIVNTYLIILFEIRINFKNKIFSFFKKLQNQYQEN